MNRTLVVLWLFALGLGMGSPAFADSKSAPASSSTTSTTFSTSADFHAKRGNTVVVNTGENPQPWMKPAPNGAIYDVSHSGWMMVNPLAPAQYGDGSKNLTAPDPNPPQPSPGYDSKGSTNQREAGGWNLFGWSF